jgi:hypothetical protein
MDDRLHGSGLVGADDAVWGVDSDNGLIYRVGDENGTLTCGFTSPAPPPGLEPGTYRLTAERSAN